MKKIYSVICFGFSLMSALFAQEMHDHILSYHSMGYDKPNLYIYDVLYQDANGIVIHHDTIGLYSSDVLMGSIVPQTKSYDNIMLWRFVRKDSNNSYKLKYVKSWVYNDLTGIRQDDTSLFIHPPRYDYFRILEFCPFPAFEKTGAVGVTWHWDFAIGPVWRIDSLYSIEDVDTFKIDYKISDTLTFKTAFGSLFCFQVDGASYSRYGTSFSKFYLNDRYGMVCFDATTKINTRFIFTLIDRISNVDSISKVDPELEYYNSFSHK